MLAGVPIKPFSYAKQRLASVLGQDERVEASKLMAANTLTCLAAAGAQPIVLAADSDVARWAAGNGWAVRLEPGSDLNQAAATIPGSAGAWAICHADLPLLQAADVAAAIARLSESNVVLAPSSDGGTSLIAGMSSQFPFSYGPGSFRRHLAATRRLDPAVVWRLGFALDLDDGSDWAAAVEHPRSVLRPMVRKP